MGCTNQFQDKFFAQAMGLLNKRLHSDYLYLNNRFDELKVVESNES